MHLSFFSYASDTSRVKLADGQAEFWFFPNSFRLQFVRDKNERFAHSHRAFEPDGWSFLFVVSEVTITFSCISLGVFYSDFSINPIRVTFDAVLEEV